MKMTMKAAAAAVMAVCAASAAHAAGFMSGGGGANCHRSFRRLLQPRHHDLAPGHPDSGWFCGRGFGFGF